MTDDRNPLAQRAEEVDAQGSKLAGEHWLAAVKSLGERMKDEKFSQQQLLEKLEHSDAAGRLFYEGMANANEEDWRKWRDSQPHRKRRIEAANRERG